MDEDELEEDVSKYSTLYQTYQSHVFETSKGSQAPSHFGTYNIPWTSEEKDLFFHGLCIHSRLRPDLIAEEITTKSITEVCEYLSLLDDASKGDDYNSSINASDAAREMSESWVIFEENCVKKLIACEPEWETQASVMERKMILQTERASLRIRKGESNPDKRDRAGEKLRSKIFEDKKERLVAKWEKDDFLKSLSPLHLSIIDNIFRESEETVRSTSRTSIDSVDIIRTIGKSSTSKHLQQAVPDPGISPVLLNATAPQSDYYTTHNSSILDAAEPIAPRRTTDATQPSTNNLGRGHIDNAEPEENNGLSPASRRRHQKRLYMRRKRAEASGRSVSNALGRLKPGRRSTKQRKEKEESVVRDTNADTSSLQSVAIDNAEISPPPPEKIHPDLTNTLPGPHFKILSGTEAEEFLSEEIPEKGLNFSGPTLPYKLKLQMAEIGLDASALSMENFDLIRLSRLGKLMRLFVNLNVEAAEIASHISSETIKFLSAHLKCFLIDVMHRIVVLQEQEDMTKMHTTVWRRREKQVTPSSVYQVLEMMNAWINKQQYFSDLLDRFKDESIDGVVESEEEQMDDESPISQSSTSDESNEGSLADEDNDDAHSFTLKQWSVTCSENTDLWQSLSRDLYASDDDYELMSISTDDEDIAELERDIEIDTHDTERDIAYERDLWRKFGRNSQGLPISNTIESTEEVKFSQNLLNMQTQANKYKSADYILDSD